MIQINHVRAKGVINGWVIATASLSFLFVVVSAFAIWSYINYVDQKTDVDTRVSAAVSDAKKEQSDADELVLIKSEKEPNRQFFGPDDYGRVTFDYPKTWSVYVKEDASSGGTFEAYLNPITVPPVSSSQLYALRVTIDDQDYDRVLASYDSLVKNGSLKSSSIKSASGSTGARLDGKFSNDLRGSAVIFKIRDKTLTIRTDANTFLADFDALVATIKFNL